LAADRVELAEYIVRQQDRLEPKLFSVKTSLCNSQSHAETSLLSVRSILASTTDLEREIKIVTVWSTLGSADHLIALAVIVQ
jgi:hypothetical protein